MSLISDFWPLFWDGAWKFLAGIFTAGVIGALSYAYVRVIRGRSEVKTKEQTSTVKEWRDLAKFQGDRYDRLAQEIRELRDEKDEALRVVLKEREDCLQLNARVLERLERYEDALKEAKIPFRPFVVKQPAVGGST